MEQFSVGELTIEIARGDIANQPDMDAIVNAANAQLKTGGGVAGAVHRAAGSELEEATRSLAPIKPGQAVITKGFDLPNDHIIHCLGPVYGQDTPEEELLANCYKNAIQLAEENNLSTIAFPAISTGAFGYPTEDAARVAFQTVAEMANEVKHLNTVRFVLWGEEAEAIHVSVASELLG